MVTTIYTLADRIAGSYARKCWWSDLDDLKQEALVALVRAHQLFDPQVGVPWEAYASLAASRAVARYLLKNSSPVSAPDCHSGATNLVGLLRAPVDENWEDPEPWADALIDDKRWRAKVRMHVQELARQCGGLHAVPVLLDDKQASEVATAKAVPVKQVYKETRRVRDRARCDLTLYELWDQRHR